MSVITAKDELAFRPASDFAPTYAQPFSVAPRAPRFGARVAAAMRWLAEQPRRRAVINELSMLTDHELSDIGLVRGELHRVFDRDFSHRRHA